MGELIPTRPATDDQSVTPPALESPSDSAFPQGMTRRAIINGALAVGTGVLAGRPARATANEPAPETPASGMGTAAVRMNEVLNPKHFGAISGSGSDAASAINAFLAAAASDPSYKFSAAGDWATASALTIDAGIFGSNSLELDFGNCRITALAPISRLLTIRDSNECRFSGKLHLRGMKHHSDRHSDWTCDVGLFCDNVSQSKFDQLFMEGFGYAAIESNRGITPTPSMNDSVHWGHIDTKRVGSGDPHLSRSLTAKWSGAARKGSYGFTTQYTQFAVDTLPIAYVLQTTNSAHVPDRPLYVEISGRLFTVIHIDAVNKVLRVFPWLTAAMGTSGTLRYHYGGALVLRGGDSNIDTFEQINCAGGSTGLELACLYGPSGGIVHTESCGSNMRVGSSNGAVMWGAFIGQRYCEGNSFNYVQVTRAASQVFIGASPATAPPSKDVDISGPLSSSNGSEFYSDEGFIGLTIGGPEGWRFRRKRFVDRAHESLDFGNPRTFDNPVFYTGAAGTASFRLVAPDEFLRKQFGLDCAQVTIMGSGANGEPRTVEFTPPAGHSVNGGEPGGSAIFSGFASVARLVIHFDGSSSWLVR